MIDREYLPTYAQLPKAEQDELVFFLQFRHGWDEQRARQELLQMEPRPFAELKWDMREAKKVRSEYNPRAGMFPRSISGY